MTNILYRKNSTPTVPNASSVKGSPLSNDEMDGNLKSISNHIDNVAGMTTSNSTEINAVKSSLNTTNANVSSLESRVGNNIDSIKSNVSNLQSGLATTNSNVSSLESRVGNNIGTTNTNVSNLQSGLATTNSNVSNLQSGLATTNSNVSGLQDKISNIDFFGDSIAIGSGSLSKVSLSGPGGVYKSNMGIGFNALASIAQVGSFSTTVNGKENIALGNESLYKNKSSYNTAIGFKAAFNNVQGDGNSSLGHESLYCNTDGFNNVAIGKNSLFKSNGSGNVAVGTGSGKEITTGNSNVIIGNNNGSSIATSSNNIILSDGDGNIRGRCDSNGVWYFGIIVGSIMKNYSTTNSGIAQVVNLKNVLLGLGWDGISDFGTFTYYNTNIVGSDATGTYALDTGTGWPAAKPGMNQIVIVNSGYIVGRGGTGSNYVAGWGYPYGPHNNPAYNGGPALIARTPISINNTGTIAKGGGGGWSTYYPAGYSNSGLSAGGGGGAGWPIGIGGGAGRNATGQNGTLTTGGTTGDGAGNGSDLGVPGYTENNYHGVQPTITGNGYITWINTGNLLGAVT